MIYFLTSILKAGVPAPRIETDACDSVFEPDIRKAVDALKLGRVISGALDRDLLDDVISRHKKEI
jgi:hypothetical protein